MVDQFGKGGGGSATDLIRVGGDLGASILAGIPEAARAIVEPLIPNIVTGIKQAFSLSIGTVFLIGVFTTAGALVVTVFMRELPLRTTMGASRVSQGSVGAEAAVGADAFDEIADDEVPSLTGAID
jgi:hypothetical protein